MKTSIQEQEGLLIATLEGRLDTSVAKRVATELEPLKQCEDCDIVLDCTGLVYIASCGLRIFLNLLQAARSKGRKVILRGANDYLAQVFNMTGFSRLFEIR